jgi:hypothetical protein
LFWPVFQRLYRDLSLNKDRVSAPDAPTTSDKILGASRRLIPVMSLILVLSDLYRIATATEVLPAGGALLLS